MAEVESPQSAVDWTEQDRLRCTERWNGANCFNLMRPSDGFSEYKSIKQRQYFYDWFDQIREVQGHEILWPAAAWVVASEMANVENPIRNAFIPSAVKPFAEEGNKAIFDDVFPQLAKVYQDGLKKNPLKSDVAKKWDRETLHHEQFETVQPIYDRYIRANPALKNELADMAGGKGAYAVGGIAINFALDFNGDILNPMDRFNYGLVVVTGFYKQFKNAIDSSRAATQAVKPDPTAGGRIKF
ncbi:MAG TPA: hypothetical protein VMB34_32520 [Acetobacteraceae bacterium]|nr:hypothetical protein [Acetobacteraceae bacterium]